MSAFALSLALLTQTRPEVFYSLGNYDAKVPKPSAILGYEIGTRHTTYYNQQRVVEAICNTAKSRTRYFEYGKSTEGRPLRVVAISSPENINRLEEIRLANEKLAHGQNDSAIKKNNPAIVWINETIHGDEAASFEAGMQLLYNLAASNNPKITEMLKQVVVILNPCYNTDGHERYVVYQNSISTGSPDQGSPEHRVPQSVNGRTNHYRFDMNRDRISFSQQETRQEIKEVLRWNPQVYCDQHGEVDTYFFPPTAMSVHAFFDRDRYNKWTDVFGKATANAFDKQGWGFFIKDTFDFYFPGYLDTWATLTGAIGMTQETDAAEIISYDADGVERSLWGGAAKHFTSALAVIGSAVANRQMLLDSYGAFKAKVVSGEWAGKNRYMTAYSTDPIKIRRLAENLRASGILVKTGEGSVSLDGESLWKEAGKFSGTGNYLLIDLAQPQGASAKMLCTNENTYEDEFVKEQLRRKEKGEGGEFYDMTGWSLPLLHDVKAWWTSSPPEIRDILVKRRTNSPAGEIGFAIRPSHRASFLAVKLLEKGLRIGFTDKEIKVSGTSFPAGTLLILKGRNEAGYDKIVDDLDVDRVAEPLNTGYPDEGRYGTGSSNVYKLRPFKAAVVFGDDSSPTPFGSTWYLMEQVFKIPFTPLTRSAVRGDLSRFSVILAPGGRLEVNDDVKKWINDGGCLVLLGGSPSSGSLMSLSTKSAGGSLPGGIAKAVLDPENWLCYGAEDSTVGVQVSGSSFYESNSNSAVKVADEEKTMLHGWTWPGESEKGIRGTACVQTQSVGGGNVVWFAEDPTERAMWPGMYPFLINAMVYGPRL
ncbi:MAG: M14 family zinc carboxypeptidase [Fimbriimonadaceae bacterium]